MNNEQNNNLTGQQPEQQPAQPANIEQPSTPTNSAPVQPIQSVQPTPPVQPVVPAQPEAPAPQMSAPVTQPVTPEPIVNNPVEPVSPMNTMNGDVNQGNYGIVPDELVEKPKKKFPIAAIVIIVLVLGLGGGAVWYFMASSPKNVIKNVITNTFKEVNNVIDEYDKVHSKFEYDNQGLLFKGKLKVDSNIFEKDEYKDMKIKPGDYYFGLNLGISPKDKSFLIGGNIEGTKKKIGVDSYYEDQKLYIISEVLDNPIVIDLKEQMTNENVEGLNEMFDGFDGMFKEVMESLEKATIKTEDIKYVSSTFEKALINSLDEKKMKKGSGTIDVNGKSINTTKITYELDKENLKRTLSSICDTLLNDDKFIEVMANITVSEKSDVKDSIKNYKESLNDLELEKTIYLNFYTTGLTNKFAGLDIEQDNKRVISYYIDGKNSEITIKGEEDIIVINITEEKEKTTIVGKISGKEYITLNINTKDPEAIDFNAILTADETKVKIEVYLKNQISKSSIKSEFKFGGEADDTTLSIEGSLELVTTNDKLTTANLSKAKDYTKLTESDYEKIMDNIEKTAKDDEALNKLYTSFQEIFEEIINENKKANESSLTCTGTSGYFKEKNYIVYDNDTSSFTNVTVYMDMDTKDLSASEAATININTYCSTLKSLDSDIKSCEATEEGTVLKATLKYDNNYMRDALVEIGYTADLNGANQALTNGGMYCTITQ